MEGSPPTKPVQSRFARPKRQILPVFHANGAGPERLPLSEDSCGMPQWAGMKTLLSSQRPQVSDFLAALASGLPRAGLWSAPVVVGVSGGADSVGLLLGLHELASGMNAQLVVAHAKHDLRLSAADDEAFVAALAARLGLQMASRELAVRHDVLHLGEGIEGRARRLRQTFFVDLAREIGARHVAVAHTADDQAETILHRSLRGTGLVGLAGMSMARQLCDGVAMVRPLLHTSGQMVRAALMAIGQRWCEDESNADTRYARNFLRHDILPRVTAGPYPAASQSLVRLGQQASLVAQALTSAAEHLLDIYSHRHTDGTVVLRVGGLQSLSAHLLAEMFVVLWRREQWAQRDMTAKHYARLAAIASHSDAAEPAVDLPGGIRARSVDRGMLELRLV